MNNCCIKWVSSIFCIHLCMLLPGVVCCGAILFIHMPRFCNMTVVFVVNSAPYMTVVILRNISGTAHGAKRKKIKPDDTRWAGVSVSESAAHMGHKMLLSSKSSNVSLLNCREQKSVLWAERNCWTCDRALRTNPHFKCWQYEELIWINTWHDVIVIK